MSLCAVDRILVAATRSEVAAALSLAACEAAAARSDAELSRREAVAVGRAMAASLAVSASARMTDRSPMRAAPTDPHRSATRRDST